MLNQCKFLPSFNPINYAVDDTANLWLFPDAGLSKRYASKVPTFENRSATIEWVATTWGRSLTKYVIPANVLLFPIRWEELSNSELIFS